MVSKRFKIVYQRQKRPVMLIIELQTFESARARLVILVCLKLELLDEREKSL